MSGFTIAEVEGRVIILDTNGNPFTASNPLAVSVVLPSPPPATTPVDVNADSVTNSQTGVYTDYTIPNGQNIVLQSFVAGAGIDTGVGAGSVVEFYSVDGAVETLIDVLFVNGATIQITQPSTAYGPGDAGGTKKIRMRRKRLTAGSVRIYGRFRGYVS